MRVEFVHSTIAESVPFLRGTLDRIVAFCHSFDSDAEPEKLYAECAYNFFSPEPSLIMFAGIDDNGKVAAHLLASLDQYYGGKFVTILQCWKNSDVDFDMGGKHGLVEKLKAWGKVHGATDVRTFARNDVVARILESYECGFVRSEKVILSVPIN